MQITHEEARKLIQFNSDQSLIPHEYRKLLAHLEACDECRTYAQQIQEVENVLLPAMKRHWNLKPAPLSVDALIGNISSTWQTNVLLVTRTALISMVFVAFALTAWQFTRSGSRTSTPMPINVFPIPTPSGQSTSTRISFPNCEELLYQVQEFDTLDSIANRFSVAKDKIMAINKMGTETLSTNSDLLIPVCKSTPTGTIHPSAITVTFTPLLGPMSSTPGG